MFENETKINLETNMMVSKNMAHKTRIFACAACLFLIIFGVAMLLLEMYVFKEGDYFTSIFCMALGAVMFLLMLCLYPIIARLSKRAMQGKESTMKYTFREEDYEAVTLMNDGTSSTTCGSYSAFTKCCEYPELWLLYLNQATVFSVRKDGMKTRTAEELSQFFMSKFGAKYKVCYKKR